MREIKFRVWDKLKKLMITEGVEWNIGMILEHKEDFDLMQFIGLKDKNGKEIYEGDILFNKGILVGEVKFGEYKCKDQSNQDRQLTHIGWFVKHKVELHGIRFSYEELSLEYLFWNLQDNLSVKKREDQNYVEVIGNIYENPELLEDKK